MSWYDYIVCLLAGTGLANIVPHFVHGISGDSFPTPFARPLVKGLFSPPVNVSRALVNLIVGHVLFRVGWVPTGNGALVVAPSLWLSVLFAKRQPLAVGLDRSAGRKDHDNPKDE
jgi:hypothetical protein